MCGRFTLTNPAKLTDANRFKLTIVPFGLKPRFNIAPSQQAPVILNESPGQLTLSRWGLIPSWANDPKIGYKMINARAETAAEKPAFRGPFKHKRCLVIADGFYEWRREGKHKTPYWMSLKSGDVFAFAGLWDAWQEPGSQEPLTSFTIITMAPNALLKPIHDRMPVILKRKDEPAWLDSRLSLSSAQELLKPYPALEMQAREVSEMVNSPTNDAPELLRPLEQRLTLKRPAPKLT